jgi:outer membrane protein OmpA-like peptidoglycan-associated protein
MKLGKCINREGCLLAYRGEIVSAPEDNFVCKECRRPLQPVSGDGNSSGTGFKKLALGFAAVIAALVLVLGGGLLVQLKRLDREPVPPKEAVQPDKENSAPAPVVAQADSSPSSQPAETAPTSVASDTPAAPADSGVSTGVVRDAAPNLDLADQSNQTTKTEVLKRIDLMPTISAGNKDKLYVSVERARQMGRIISIPFGSGKTSLGNSDAEKLKTELLDPQIQKLLQDPTAVFVVLGYADTKGDEKTNLRISQERADSTLQVLRNKCGVVNVLHAVAMGGSTLFDEKGLGKNRAAEVWVVLP